LIAPRRGRLQLQCRSDQADAIIVVSHATMHATEPVFGPAHNVVEFLESRGDDVVFVLHPLTGRGPSRYRHTRAGAECCDGVWPSSPTFAPFRYLVELGRNVHLLSTGSKPAVLVDPLNHLAWTVARAFRATARPSVFYGVDYAENRFRNRLANAAYHAVDRLAARTATSVWSVSGPLHRVRSTQGVATARNHLVPNAPEFEESSVKPLEARQAGSLALIGNFEEGYDTASLIEALGRLAREVPGLRLVVIGAGSSLTSFLDALAASGLSGVANPRGMLSHATAMEVLSGCRVGLAPYGTGDPWHGFRDSLKIREYLALGLPVVTTGGHWLAEVVSEAGAGTIAGTATELVDAIHPLLTDERRWSAASRAALDIARDTSRNDVIERALDALPAPPMPSSWR
jgi:glycosyltransferase involved in cell wall biosynthesis